MARDSLIVARTIEHLGMVSQVTEELEDAQALYEKALALRQKISPDSLAVALTLNNLGTLLLNSGDQEQASGYFSSALRIQESLAPKGIDIPLTLANLGALERSRQNWEGAKVYHRRALEISESISPRDKEVVANLNALGDIALAEGDAQAAYEFYFRALKAWKGLLPFLGGSYAVQAGFRDKNSEYYRDIVSLLIESDRIDEAFYHLEEFRAQTFLMMLAERDIAFSAGLPPDLDRERRRLRFKRERVLKEMAKPDHSAEDREAGYQELESLDQKAGDLEARIRRESPNLASLRYPQAMGVKGVSEILEVGELIVAFYVDGERTYAFTLNRDGHISLEVLKINEEELRTKVRRFRFLLSDAVGQSSIGVQRRLDLQGLSRELQEILLEPLIGEINKSRRLLVLPDGPLHALPFAALIDSSGEYLVEKLPIRVALSATVYVELKKNRGGSLSKKGGDASAPLRIAAFGDPAYSYSAFGPGNEFGVEKRDEGVYRSATYAWDRYAGFTWRPLPASRLEVEGIARLFPEEQVHTFLGYDALETNFKSLDKTTDVVHVAAHSYLDQEIPSNSLVAFAVPGDISGVGVSSQEDGLLHVWEIYEDVRINADLVVLSACNTGMGQELGGEGLIGLTRAFQYAGARSVVASLWSVADQATSELMIRFYRHLRSGLSKDEALRAAQIELIRGPIEVRGPDGQLKEKDVSSPYFWAAFQVFGDWQ